MNQPLNKIINETVDALIDQVEDKLVDCMYEYGEYTESNDDFALDHEYLTKKVVLELYNKLKKI